MPVAIEVGTIEAVTEQLESVKTELARVKSERDALKQGPVQIDAQLDAVDTGIREKQRELGALLARRVVLVNLRANLP
jgi:chromosome segregation ATPase